MKNCLLATTYTTQQVDYNTTYKDPDVLVLHKFMSGLSAGEFGSSL